MIRISIHGPKRYLLLLIIFLFLGIFSCEKSNKVTVYRDSWGVPHIYANSEANMAYAFGYAQAEDRLIQILKFYRYAEGTLAEAFGEDYIEIDYRQRVWQHVKISRDKFSDLSPDIQKIARYFVAGIKQYMKDFPDEVPDWAPDIHPWHVVAWGRAFIWDWPLGQAMADLHRGKRKMAEPHHSNQWVVSPKRTELDVPIALIDPHLNFETTGHWVEVRLHAGDLQVAGMCVAGTPFVGLGHNRFISWAATTGGPDCADVYQLDINPENSLQYRYDGRWRDITTEKVIIRVKEEDGFREVERLIERCHYGPIQERQGNKAFAIRCAYENEVLLAEQMFLINKAKNVDEFIAALAMCQLMPQNMMCAGIDGNIYYARTGRVPIRPEGYDWNYPVPGNSEKSEWQGIHPHKDLVQIKNPKSEFMQNCNISPGTMMPNSPLTENKYRKYIYNDSQTRSNPRGRSAIRLLAANDHMTIQDAKQIALDTSVDGYKTWLEALNLAYETHGSSNSDLKAAVNLILNWNGHLDADNEAAPLYRFWRFECSNMKVNFITDENGTIKDFSESDQKKMLSALKNAMNYLKEKFADFKIPWGETIRLQRGDKSWAVSGGAFENGLSVLRAVDGKLDQETGITEVTRGQSCCMVVILSDPIQSFSVLPYGQSDDPDSPHYADQGEKLFSKSKFKSTYFYKDDLMNNLASEQELLVPDIRE